MRRGAAPGAGRRRLCSSAALVALLPGGADGLVDCGKATDCAARRRQECNPLGTVPNACGDCLLGNFGGKGPSNAYCLANTSCAAIYPGLDYCPIPGVNKSYGNPQLPFVLPFGKCVCDDGNGFRWPTGAGSCGRVRMEDEEGSGYYAIERCTSRTCEPSTCRTLGTWAPLMTLVGGSVQFDCKQTGADSAALLDNCAEAVGNVPDSAFCGHPGLVNSALASTPEYILRCVVAPRCPASVRPDNLDETCCLGTAQSFVQNGTQQVRATGFCARKPPTGTLFGKPVTVEIFSATGFRDADAQLQGNSDPYCKGGLVGKPDSAFRTKTVDDSQSPTFDMLAVVYGPEKEDVFEFSCWDRDYPEGNDDALGHAQLRSDMWERGFSGDVQLNGTSGANVTLKVRIALQRSSSADDCAVRTNGRGWTGCACLDVEGRPTENRVCSTTCSLEGCRADGTGIPPTPQEWVTSEVPDAFVGQSRSARVAGASAAAPRRRASPLGALAALLAASLAAPLWR